MFDNEFDFVENQWDNSLKMKLDWNMERYLGKRLFDRMGPLPSMTNSEKMSQLGSRNWVQGVGIIF